MSTTNGFSEAVAENVYSAPLTVTVSPSAAFAENVRVAVAFTAAVWLEPLITYPTADLRASFTHEPTMPSACVIFILVCIVISFVNLFYERSASNRDLTSSFPIFFGSLASSVK